MIADPGFEARTLDVVRRLTDDIAECDAAEITVIFVGGVPLVRFVFWDEQQSKGVAGLRGAPMLAVQLVTESRKHPLAPGRIIQGDELRRHVRNSVENYFKLNGLEITRKSLDHACL